MSKIGKVPIIIPTGVTISLQDAVVTVNGQKGSLSFTIPEGISMNQEETRLVIASGQQKELRPLFGLTRAYIANMIKGVSDGFEKKLELSGVGYRAQVMGNDLQISVGFSHPVKIPTEAGIQFSVAENIISIAGIDKDKVGNMAARIRAIRPPEPYKGKGIKYVGEKIRRKAGKAAKAVGGK